jgi:eukaryotic-like serine/threonine-protein kinase
MVQISSGDILCDRYRVDAFVASGGFGEVYKVYDLRRSTALAMKVLKLDLSDEPAALKSFEREANALQEFKHPHIVPFYGVEKTDDIIFLLEAFIEGPSLRDVIQRNRGTPMNIPEALTLLKALCSALNFAHGRGVIHCDVKPGNVLIDRGGDIYLTDFGIARIAGSSGTTLAGLGTPAYMAPEQHIKGTVSPETDVYALGVLLFELLTGERPFRATARDPDQIATTDQEIRNARLHQPPDPRSLNPSIPPPLAEVILKALEETPAERYPGTIALLEAACDAWGCPPTQIPERYFPAQELYKKPPPDEKPVPPRPVSKIAVISGSAVGLAVLLFLATRFGLPLIFPTPTATVTSQAPTQTEQPRSTASVTPSATATVPPTETSTPPPRPSPSAVPTPTIFLDTIYIPAGDFLMGATDRDAAIEEKLDDELPAHTVTLDGYSIDRTEVTNAMFAAFVKAQNYKTVADRNPDAARVYDPRSPVFIKNPDASWRDPTGSGRGIAGKDQYPVVQIAWADADAFCRWVGGRLPTEAEWEKAARGSDGRVYPWGNTYDGNLLNGSDKTLGLDPQLFIYKDGYDFTSPVGTFPKGASPSGLMDMSGNVLEWVNDIYSNTYYQVSPSHNPKGPESGSYHVLRGGSWYSGPKNSRAAHRVYPGEIDVASQNYGFRCAYDQ